MSVESTKKNNVVVTFGCNDDDQCGLQQQQQQQDESDGPPPPKGLTHVSSLVLPHHPAKFDQISIVAVSCGSRHSLALSANGVAFSWGWGDLGQLGHRNLDDAVYQPIKEIEFFRQQNQPISVAYLSAGGCHSGVVTTTGLVYTWGEALWGQLGFNLEGENTHQMIPASCPVLSAEERKTDKIAKLSCGGTHTSALTENGKVYTWGRGDNGQLGIGRFWLENESNDLGVSVPTLVKGFDGEKVVQVACGAFHTAAVTLSGNVYTWGKEDYGMLGLGHTSDIYVPTKVEEFNSTNPAMRVSCGGWHTVVVTRKGCCFSFGRGEYGRLGLSDGRHHSRPAEVEALKGKRVIQAACGGTHTLFLTDEGEAYSVGRADHGRLGYVVDDPAKSVSVPTICLKKTDTFPGVVQVSAGGAHSMALLSNNMATITSPMIQFNHASGTIPVANI